MFKKIISRISFNQGFTAIILTLAGLWVSISYNRFQSDWTIKNFLIPQIHEFSESVYFRNMSQMLDWDASDIYDNFNPAKLVATVDSDTIADALSKEEGDFDEPLYSIRQSEIMFLDKLVVFQSYVDSHLISQKDLKPLLEPYIHYYISGVTKEDAPEYDVVSSVWKYIETHDQYSDASKLLKSFSITNK